MNKNYLEYNADHKFYLKKIIDKLIEYENDKNARNDQYKKIMSDPSEYGKELLQMSLFDNLEREYNNEMSKGLTDNEKTTCTLRYLQNRSAIQEKVHKYYENHYKEVMLKVKARYMDEIIKHITNYFFCRLSEFSSFENIFDIAKLLCLDLMKPTYGEDSEVFKNLKEGFELVTNLYKINEISIDEIKLLPSGQKCLDVMIDLDVETILDCLKNTQNYLFVSVDRANCKGVSYTYHAVCLSKENITQIISNSVGMEYSCNKDDLIVYITLPIGPGGVNVYIPLLSAIMILQYDKLIFYLLKQDAAKCDGFTEPFKYCDSDTNKTTPIMHIAKCGGFNCAPKGWTGATDLQKNADFVSKATEEGGTGKIDTTKVRRSSRSQKTVYGR